MQPHRYADPEKPGNIIIIISSDAQQRRPCSYFGSNLFMPFASMPGRHTHVPGSARAAKKSRRANLARTLSRQAAQRQKLLPQLTAELRAARRAEEVETRKKNEHFRKVWLAACPDKRLSDGRYSEPPTVIEGGRYEKNKNAKVEKQKP